MSRYMVLGGFLGAGKTTAMIAFAEHFAAQGKTPAILVNDLGADNLVDGAYTGSAAPCCMDTITGGCICYQTQELVDKLRRFRDTSRADVIMSDIPGCGIGGLDHVYLTLAKNYPGEFDICPFVAVADPERLRMIMPENANINLPDEMSFLFDAQLREAEVILLNKIDTLSEEKLGECMDFLVKGYPNAKVFAVSAKTGEGIAAAADHIAGNRAELVHREIGYGGKEFIAAERRLSWYNRKFFAKCEAGRNVDGNEFITALFDKIRQGLKSANRNVPHLKAYASGAGKEFAKASLIGVDYDVAFDARFDSPQSDLRVILNARAACESEVLDFLMDGAVKATCRKFGMRCHVFFTECFGMTDEGND